MKKLQSYIVLCQNEEEIKLQTQATASGQTGAQISFAYKS